MKLLITGANGMLGHEIQRAFSSDELFLTDINEMDVSNRRMVLETVRDMPWKPDYILHLAAETDLEQCEINPHKALAVNAIGTAFLTDVALALDIPIIYISTAGIFLGSDPFYVERSMGDPKNIYGLSKFLGENYVRGHQKHYIFRMSWAMGGGRDIDKKFVNKVIKQIEKGVETIYGITDIYGSPTYAKDVAHTIKESLMLKIPYGIYHTAGIGSASRCDVAKAIVDITNAKVNVVPVTAKEFSEMNKDFPCPRAHNETIISTKEFPSQMRGWRESLEEYLTEFFV